MLFLNIFLLSLKKWCNDVDLLEEADDKHEEIYTYLYIIHSQYHNWYLFVLVSKHIYLIIS